MKGHPKLTECPGGCGHRVDQHGQVRVAFNKALAPRRRDYDAMSCHATVGPLGKPIECRCCIKADKWDRLTREAAGSGALFE